MNTTHPTHSFQRAGFTIIEVLTSVVVAMIGVFGVMALIPFAVKQAQTGLDSDAATAVARNAFAQFEIAGCHLTDDDDFDQDGDFDINEDLYDWTADGATRISAAAPEVFCIDPLGVSENLSYDVFPFNAVPALNGTGSFPNRLPLSIRSANLFVIRDKTPPVGVAIVRDPMDVASARRMFRAADDLVFGEAVNDLSGPVQIFDRGTPGDLKRQVGGRISWCALVVPSSGLAPTANPSLPVGGSPSIKFRMFVLVFKDRNTTLVASGGDDLMRTAKLDPSANRFVHSPLSTVYLEAGTLIEGTGIRKDDWVMLINRAETDPSVPGYPTAVPPAIPGYEKQIAFARVVGFSDATVSGTLPSITLNGPDFNFGDPNDLDATAPFNIISETHIVHLKDVVGVYERTFSSEGNSTWNVVY